MVAFEHMVLMDTSSSIFGLLFLSHNPIKHDDRNQQESDRKEPDNLTVPLKPAPVKVPVVWDSALFSIFL